MRCARWLLAVVFAVALFAVPSMAVGQDDPPASDVPAQVVPEDPSADDPAPPDATLEPPAVLEDPSGDVPAAPAVGEAPVALAAPPVQELSRFSDDTRAPRWQQRDSWRERGVFYRWRSGWFLHRGPSWWRWDDRRWSPCPQPGDWSPPVVRPVPVSDPSPGHHFDAVRDAVAPIVAPQSVPRPTQHNRAQVVRRALRVCQARYARSVIVLRTLRRHGRITFVQYQRGVRVALARRAVCRREVLRLLSVHR